MNQTTLIQNLFRNYIQESSDFRHSCPMLVCSGHSNSSALLQDCVMLYSCLFPFILLHSLFPRPPLPPYTSFFLLHQALNSTSHLYPSSNYYTKQCHFSDKVTVSHRAHLHTCVQRKNGIGLYASQGLEYNSLFIRSCAALETILQLLLVYLCSKSAWLTVLPF